MEILVLAIVQLLLSMVKQGILRYRGYPIEDLVKQGVSFTDVSYLLLYGELEESQKKTDFKEYIRTHANIHEDMNRFFNGFPLSAHPMAILSSMVTALIGFNPDGDSQDPDVKMRILQTYCKG